mgnify:CR=1 FL=1
MSKPDKPIFNQQGGRGKLYGPTHGATYMGTYQMPDGKMDRRMFNCATNKDAIKAYTDWCADMDARILEEMEEKVRPKAKAQQPKEKPAYTEPFKKDEVKGADMATTADAKLDKIYVVMVVGGVAVGGGTPVTIQSMCNTKTEDAGATIEQILRLEQAGCEIVRVTVPTPEAAEAVEIIKNSIHIPLVADIHFDYRLAIAAAEHGADKIRINPGNIGGEDRVKAVVDCCRAHKVPIRIGVNGGSLEKELLAKYGRVTPEALVESALGHVALLEKYDFTDICISVKSSDVPLNMAAYRLLHERVDYPLHLGVTEAGTPSMGVLKSAIGIGGLLCEGIGDTMRVSLTADPVEEVYAAKRILRACGLRRSGVNLISCPTCGRTAYDMIPLAEELERRLEDCDKPITVAVMGCVVNGPGEASAADIGVAGGKGEGLIFCHGEVLYKVAQEKLLDALLEEIEKL